MKSTHTNKQDRNVQDDLGELFQQVSVGDRKAFHELYLLTHEQVYSYLFRYLQDRDLVDDVLMDTYVEVWKNASKFKYQSRVTTWIVGIARNLAMNHYRRTRKLEELTEEHSSLAMYYDDDSDLNSLLSKALGRLPENHREVLGLVLLPEFTYQQISDVLEIPLNTVKSRIYYAKGALKKVLTDMGVDSNAI